MNILNYPCSIHFDIRLVQRNDPLVRGEGESLLRELKATRGLFAANPVTINADPFLFARNGRLYLFYEEMGKIYTRGKIKMISTSDLKDWTEPQIVLDEPFHLSYPFVFEAEGEVRMIPECWRFGGIRLYRAADETLTRWIFDRELIRGDRLVDSSVFFQDGFYYLHTCSIEQGRSLLRLFTSRTLAGPWREHGSSPVAESRNGGSLYRHDGKLYRFAQRCDSYYGSGLDLYEITELSPDTCREILAQPRFLSGGHHCNILRFQGKTVVAEDRAFFSFMFPEFGRRVCHYLPSFGTN